MCHKWIHTSRVVYTRVDGEMAEMVKWEMVNERKREARMKKKKRSARMNE